MGEAKRRENAGAVPKVVQIPISITVDIIDDSRVGNIYISSGFTDWIDTADLLNRALGRAIQEYIKQRQRKIVEPTNEDIVRLKS